MVERYAREEMSSKWTQHARYAAWLEVEKAAVKAWNRLGLIPDEDCEKILENSFLINLSANSLNFAELQLIAKRKNMPYSVFYFESKPNPFHFLGIQP